MKAHGSVVQVKAYSSWGSKHLSLKTKTLAISIAMLTGGYRRQGFRGVAWEFGVESLLSSFPNKW